MAVVYLGIGSNLGDKRANCLRAVEALRCKGISVSKESALYETEPWGLKDQPMFINMAVEAETTLLPMALLDVLKDVEKEMGRLDSDRWGPRVIDLDILLYDDLVLSTEELIIPHLHLHEREFALGPLAEIAPGVIHPLMSKNIAELLGEVKP
jgi:2-amino-4-hydroxy-6-hydroxymethyldihydropteridine diphosphokinase